VKLCTIIYHTSGHCSKGFRGQSSVSNRIIVQQRVEANGRKQFTICSTLWL